MNSSRNADYSLSVGATAPSTYNGRSLPSNAVGVTGVNGGVVQNAGSVYVDRLTASATYSVAAATAFGQASNALGTGLGRAGSHEIGHFLFQQAFDSNKIQGVMHAGFSGMQWFTPNTEGMWTFDAHQRQLMDKRCEPLTTDRTLPNIQPVMRPPIGGGGGIGLGGGGNYPWWWYAMWEFADDIDDIPVGGNV